MILSTNILGLGHLESRADVVEAYRDERCCYIVVGYVVYCVNTRYALLKTLCQN